MLCKQLADHFNTTWVEEYAREYLLKYGTNYSFENLLDVAKGQIELEEKGAEFVKAQNAKYITQNLATGQAGSKLFVDTDMYVMKVWCEFVFDKCHHWILNRIAERKYDLYLLCNIDLPWVKDELREYPDLVSRQKLYNYYKDIMINQNIPWVDISGNYEERLAKAIAALKRI